MNYLIECDRFWRTVAGRVDGWVGSATVSVAIRVSEDQRWWLNDSEVPAVEGCYDLDLNFSPSTNTLPIRRLHLGERDSAEVRAAWLKFPNFNLEPLVQTYRRTGPKTYRYESSGGSFKADLEVDESGLVTLYPNLCEVETMNAEGTDDRRR